MKTQKKRTPKTGDDPKVFPGLTFPGMLLPLSVYGCWMYGGWEDLGERNMYFTFEDGEVVVHDRGKDGKRLEPSNIGKLPEGLHCMSISCDQTGDSGYFVGRKGDLEAVAKWTNDRSTADDMIAKLLIRDA